MSDERKPRTIDEYVSDMHRSIKRLIDISSSTKDKFMIDEDKKDAAIRHIEVLGEIATKLIKHYQLFIKSNSHINFQKIKGMRNRLTHGYFEIDLNIVWDVAKNEIPELQRQLDQVVMTPQQPVTQSGGKKR